MRGRACSSRSAARSRSASSTGSTRPANPLPSIRRLAAVLGVSVTTVTAAYEALRQDGFVTSRRRSGFFVDGNALADPGHAPAAGAAADGAAPVRLDYDAHFAGRTFDVRRVRQAGGLPGPLPLPVRLRPDRPAALPHRELARVRARLGQRRRGRQLGDRLLGHRRRDAGRAADRARARQARHRRPAGRGAADRRRPAGAVPGAEAAAGPGRDAGRGGSGLSGHRQHGPLRGHGGGAAAGRRAGARAGRGDGPLQVRLRDAEPPVPDHGHDAARTQGRAAAGDAGQRPVRDRGRLRVGHQLQPDAAAGAQEPRRVGQRGLRGEPVEVAAAGAAHRLPGGRPGVHPRGAVATPPHAQAPARQQPAVRGAVPAARPLRPVRGRSSRRSTGSAATSCTRAWSAACRGRR